MKRVIIFYFLLLASPAFAQKSFSKEALVAVVKRFHPVAKQALLDVAIADAGITTAKAVFDPVFSSVNEKKEWQGTTYYDQQQHGLSIPVWYGIDLNAGSETIRGDKINPEETKGSINYVSVSVPLLQNFIIDKRKAIVQQARLVKNETAANRDKIVNDLLYEAITAYWEWWEQEKRVRILNATVTNAAQRFQMVRSAYLLGERPAVDTIESMVQLETLRLSETEAIMELARKRLAVSVYLWTADDTPYELPGDVVPVDPTNEVIILDSVLASVNTHPEIQAYDFKLDYLSLEKKLKRQGLVPAVYFKYNHAGYDLSQTITGAWNNNYRLGVSVAVPLRLSEARGEYRSAGFKLAQARLGKDNKLLLLQNKLKQYYTEWLQARQQQSIQQQIIRHFTALQKAEETRFFNGESSIFLVNARESKKLESLEKNISLEAKTQKAIAALRWTAGILHR